MHGKKAAEGSEPPRFSRRTRRSRCDGTGRLHDGRCRARAHADPVTHARRSLRAHLQQPAAVCDAERAAHRGAHRARQARRHHGCQGSARSRPDPAHHRAGAAASTIRTTPRTTAGTTFFGQFVDHDVTFDLGSALGEPTRPEDSTNTRSPALDLDSVYGGGPVRSPQLYGRRSSREPLAGIKLRVEHGGLFEDLPRTADGTAILGDPRNDEHVILAGLHAAFLMFHNEAVDYVAARNRRVEHGRDLPRSAAPDALALSMDHRARVPAADHRAAARQQHSAARPAHLSTRRSASCRSSSRARAIAWATAWCVRRIARTWPATTARRSSLSSSILRRKARPIRPTCAAACARRDVSSAGRRSSTSATATCGRTSGSTRRCRHRCSSCRARRLPATTDRNRSRSAQSPAPHHVVAAVGTSDRACDGCAGAVER